MSSLRWGRNAILPGQYYDVETGLNYNYFRDYDPGTGRYVESDPIGLAGGSWSIYTYAGSDPIDQVDYFGLAQCTLVLAGGKARCNVFQILLSILLSISQ
jgi:RHS repeat-associated protein